MEELGARLAGLLRSSDCSARLSGEKGGLRMPNTDTEGALALCERIRADVRDHLSASADANRPLTVSIGLTTSWAEEAARFDTLYARADNALYEAKRQGRDRVERTL